MVWPDKFSTSRLFSLCGRLGEGQHGDPDSQRDRERHGPAALVAWKQTVQGVAKD